MGLMSSTNEAEKGLNDPVSWGINSSHKLDCYMQIKKQRLIMPFTLAYIDTNASVLKQLQYSYSAKASVLTLAG